MFVVDISINIVQGYPDTLVPTQHAGHWPMLWYYQLALIT